MYMVRVYMLTFLGEPKDHHAYEHAHESPPVMTRAAACCSAVLAVVAGFVVFEPRRQGARLRRGFLAQVESVLERAGAASTSTGRWRSSRSPRARRPRRRPGTSGRRTALAPRQAARASRSLRLLVNKFYIDDFYQWVINNVVLGFASVIAFFDREVVNDTGVNGPGEVDGAVGCLLKFPQTGKLPNYALAMIVGVVVLAIAGFSVKG